LILDLILFCGGLALLYFGAEWLVSSAARIAADFGISSFILGLTLVSFGTSAPELVVSGLASYRGSGGLAMGNVLGSNIANIALILGIAALILPIRVRPDLLSRDLPIMLGSAALVPLLGWSGTISRAEGGLLLTLFVLYLGLLGVKARREAVSLTDLVGLDDESVPRSRLARDLGVALAGLVALSIGANLLVGAASRMAVVFGVPDVVIGLTLVAFGTSLPELAASVSAALRGESQLVIGNIVGSNIFNVLLILGVAAMVGPLPVPGSTRIDALIVLGLSLAMLPVVLTGRRVDRVEGGILFASYLGFLLWVAT
jgi:cation:H+ antiporter